MRLTFSEPNQLKPKRLLVFLGCPDKLAAATKPRLDRCLIAVIADRRDSRLADAVAGNLERDSALEGSRGVFTDVQRWPSSLELF
jgi:hypothetical protein